MFFSVFSHPSFPACSNPIEFTCNLHHVHPFLTLLLAVRQPRFTTFPRHAPEAAEIKKVPICQTQNVSLASEYPECLSAAQVSHTERTEGAVPSTWMVSDSEQQSFGLSTQLQQRWHEMAITSMIPCLKINSLLIQVFKLPFCRYLEDGVS